MIRFKLQERMADLAFKRGSRVTVEEVAQATGIHRSTLSKMNRPTGANVNTDNLDRLCFFLECQLHELVDYIPSDPPPSRKKL